jgi:PAS domain S-box-containing protein
MMNFNAEPQLSGFQPGDHLCLTYETRAEQVDVIVPFIRDGLASGDCCVYIADDQTIDEVVAELAGAGIDVGGARATGALQVLSKRETYLRTGVFDPQAMIAFLSSTVEAALADGFSGCRMTGEMTWALGTDIGCERLIEYEALLNDNFFRTSPAIAICQYNRRRFPPEIIRDVLRTHPTTILGGRICANPYYEPSELVLGKRPEAERVDWMIDQIQRREQNRIDRQRAEQAIRESEERHRTLMELMPAAVYACDAPSGAIRYYNRRAVELWGREPVLSDSQERYCGAFRLFWSDGRPLPHAETPMAAVLKGGPPVRNLEVIIERPDGSRITAMVNIDPITDSDGRLVGAVNVFQDVTEKNRLFQELQHSEERYRHLIAAIPAAVYTTDAQGRVTLFNEHAAELWGRRPEIGKDQWCGSWRIYRPDGSALPLDECPMAVALRDKRRVRGEEIVVERPDGTRAYVLPHPEPLFDPAGDMIGAVNMLVDITERKRAEQERVKLLLAEQTARADAEHARQSYQELVDGLDAIVWDADAQSWRFNFVSRRAEEILGYPVERWLADPHFWSNLIHPEDREATVDLCRTACAECRDHDFEYRAIAADGRTVWLRDIVYVVKNEDGQAKQLRGIMIDVTRTKQLEQDLQKRAAELAEADRRKDEFLAMLGHELRNPLAPIRTGLDLLHASGIEHEAIDLMREQTDCVVRLVDDLLDVSRVMRGKIRLRKEAVDLASAARRAVESVGSLIRERGHRLTVSAPEQIWVFADAVRLGQIITNLLNNAAKYTEPGGHIRLTIEQEDGHAGLSVRDNGLGIEREYLASIFEPFTQSDRAREYAQGGLGVGLTLVRSLVQLHDGSITAHSDGPGTGSEFRLLLPLVERRESKAAASPTRRLSDPCRILIVDDNITAAKMLKLLMVQFGDHQIELAHDGPSALDLVKTHRPDVVLLDIGLPGMSGHEIAQTLRKNQNGTQMLLAALTGFGTAEDRNRSLQAGFDLHLVKPASAADLQRVLQHPKLAVGRSRGDGQVANGNGAITNSSKAIRSH